MTVEPFRQFAIEVSAVTRLSPSFVWVTFTGKDLDSFADTGYDQRIKLVFPVPGSGLAHFPDGPDWFLRWRELPDEQRNPIRTYTVRAVRPQQRELDVDMVHHGDSGPACRWVVSAAPGDRLLVIGPNAAHPGPHGGIEFHPPAGAGALLLAGDETAVPAICAILERLPGDARGEAVLEVPHADDVLPVAAPAGVRVSWLPRGEGAPGAALIPAVQAAAERLAKPAGKPAAPLADIDIDRELLWEVPLPAPEVPTEWYAWLAGEAGAIKTLRRYLVAEVGLDRRSVAFMGYWRLGRPEV